MPVELSVATSNGVFLTLLRKFFDEANQKGHQYVHLQLPSISVHKITSIRSVTQLAGPKTAVAKSESGEEPWQTTWMPDPI